MSLKLHLSAVAKRMQKARRGSSAKRDRKLKRRRGAAPPGAILGAFRKSVAADAG